MRSFLSCLVIVCSMNAAVVVQATPINSNGTDGLRSASALFDDTGGVLTVTLTNTADADVTIPVEILTALFFDSLMPLSLTPVSATLGVGSTVLFGGTDPGDVVGGEWAYKSGLVGTPGNQVYGISSTGLGLFGPGDLFPGSNLQGPASPNGLEYGITTANDDPTTGNTPVTGMNALIQHQVVFVLSGLPDGFDASRDIGNVFFQYGTSLDEGGHAPEPSVAWFLIIGGFVAFRRRIRPAATC